MAVTDATGIATAPTLKANTVAGGYTMDVSANPATLGLLVYNDPGPAATITAFHGDSQSAIIGTAFANYLAVLVLDSFGNGLNDAPVTYSAPTSGPSATFSSGASSGISTRTTPLRPT